MNRCRSTSAEPKRRPGKSSVHKCKSVSAASESQPHTKLYFLIDFRGRLREIDGTFGSTVGLSWVMLGLSWCHRGRTWDILESTVGLCVINMFIKHEKHILHRNTKIALARPCRARMQVDKTQMRSNIKFTLIIEIHKSLSLDSRRAKTHIVSPECSLIVKNTYLMEIQKSLSRSTHVER